MKYKVTIEPKAERKQMLHTITTKNLLKIIKKKVLRFFS